MNRLSCGLLVAASLGFGMNLNAGVVYDFSTTMVRPRSTEKVNGRIWTQDQSYRAEFERGGVRMIVISRDGDETATILNPAKATWSNRARVSSDIRSAELFLWPSPNSRVRGKPKVVHRLDGTSTVAGEPAVQHIIEATFQLESRISGAPLRGTLRMTVKISTSNTLPPLPMQQRRLRTGYAEVDRELEKAERNVQGMVLRHELEVTRAFEGGPPQIERTTTEISNLERSEVEESQFVVPAEYVYAGPMAQ